jgi:DNA polymerase III epsilon subunit-like protein
MSYAVIDTEGNGIFDHKKPADAPGQPRMAALGLILLNDKFEVEEKHGWLIRPEGWTFDNDSDAAKKNGLTHECLMAEGVDVREPLRAYGDAIDQRRIVVGFNVPHDLKTLRAEARYVGFPDRYMQTRYICVMQGCRMFVDARTADGKKKAPRLEEACSYYGIDQGTGAHTGLGDAESALQILLKLAEIGAVPEFTDPYEKASVPKKAHRAHLDRKTTDRPQGRDYEEQVLREQQDFLRGASEDGK